MLTLCNHTTDPDIKPATSGTDYVHFAMENENRSDVLSMQGKRKKCKLMDSANFEVDPFVVPKGVVSLAINWDYLQKVSSFQASSEKCEAIKSILKSAML